MTKLNLITVAILSAMPNGYRRAGFALAQGETQVDVTPEQLESLQADKRLTVVAINLDEVKKLFPVSGSTFSPMTSLAKLVVNSWVEWSLKTAIGSSAPPTCLQFLTSPL